MFQALGTVLFPVILVAGLGALLSSRLPIDQATISRITLYLLSPALVLNTVLTTPVRAAEALQLGAAYLGVLVLCVGLGWLCGVGRPRPEQRSLAASVGIWNSGNMGLPIALFAFGKAGFDRATLLFLMSFIGMYVVGPLLYGGAAVKGLGGLLRTLFRLPAITVALVALAWRLLHLPVPAGVSRGVELLSQATLPMVLLSLGLQLGAGGWPRLHGRLWLATAARLLGGPLIALGVGTLVGLQHGALAVLVLSAGMPTAVNALLLGREYGGDTETVAGVVLLSTLASVVTIAVVVTLLPLL